MKPTKLLLGVTVAAVTAACVNSVQAVTAPAGDLPNMAATSLPSNYTSSPAIADVVKLVQAGVGDAVLASYINHASVPFNPTATDLIYLKDLGLSDAAMQALLPVNPADRPTSARTPVQGAPAQQPMPTPPAPLAAGTPQQQVTASSFYEPLSPYGKWVMVPGTGYCWQPTVAVVDPGWRPYAQRGHWIDTDCGWYWESDYSWGWAAFHYGRWSQQPRLGWVWSPDTVWAPAWVSWRHSDDYCGWAPLPPTACYRPGWGLSYYDGRNGVSIEFGLRHDHYTFVHNSHFYDRQPFRHAAPPTQVVNIYQTTTVVNHYTTVNNTTVINHGASYAVVSKAAAAPVTKVTIKDLAAAPGNHPGSLVNSGRGPGWYRAPLTAPQPEKVQAVVKQLANHAGLVTLAPVRSAEVPPLSPKPARHDSPLAATTTPRPMITLPGASAAHVAKAEMPEEAGKRPLTDERLHHQPGWAAQPVQANHPSIPQIAPRPVENHLRNLSSPAVVPALPPHGQNFEAPHSEVQPPVHHETPPVLPPLRTPSLSRTEVGHATSAYPVPAAGQSGKLPKFDAKGQEGSDRPGRGAKADQPDKR